ncbi:sulfur oxidation c-type cytochrome SoxX [Azospirillum sp. ST 5-10]|uniref:sulfur oxidation c-type cytochrome SoxX n=1 Tax=unclassified Azospirillum TaxID=2630922 RepID=UPI003F4A37BB
MIRTAFLAAAVLLAGGPALAQSQPSSWGPGADDAAFERMLKTSFKEKGIVKLDRLKQDETQTFCSDPDAASSPASAARREQIEKANLATVKWPADGKWLGDWKSGEAIAQSGRGNTWTDKADQVNGGNCYNCHQITSEEISYGTIGPSLYNYGKIRGADEEVMRATWAKIYNAKSNNACSNMPRAGHMGILSEAQMKDVMALLLDPQSPVNQ